MHYFFPCVPGPRYSAWLVSGMTSRSQLASCAVAKAVYACQYLYNFFSTDVVTIDRGAKQRITSTEATREHKQPLSCCINDIKLPGRAASRFTNAMKTVYMRRWRSDIQCGMRERMARANCCY